MVKCRVKSCNQTFANPSNFAVAVGERLLRQYRNVRGDQDRAMDNPKRYGDGLGNDASQNQWNLTTERRGYLFTVVRKTTTPFMS